MELAANSARRKDVVLKVRARQLTGGIHDRNRDRCLMILESILETKAAAILQFIGGLLAVIASDLG
jgi:hypothetical protein